MATAVRDYEAVLIAQPELNEEGVSKLQAQFGDLITRQGGRVLQTSPLGKRKMSYRIKRFSEGIYLKVQFEIPPSEISTLAKTAGLIESMIRLMVFQGVAASSEDRKQETFHGESK